MSLQHHPRIANLTYISIFSGIEAASVAWESLGFQPLAFAEVDPFPSAVLEARFPHVPNLGDVTKVNWSEFHGKADIVVGGSPCQAFSIAGKRAGLADERGKLMLEYVRAVREVQPTYCIWENVPGALSQDGGRAFATLLEELEDCGYALAWRVLDAQFAGVAQRRRRVFLVGVSKNRLPVGYSAIQRAGEILFEPCSLRGDHPSSRQKREELARAAGRGSVRASVSGVCGNVIRRREQSGDHQIGVNDENLSFVPTTGDKHAVCSPTGPLNPWDSQTARVYHGEGIAPTLTSNAAGGYKGGAVLDSTAYTLKIRGGCEGGGKGALVQENVSATLSTRQDQTVFQPAATRELETRVAESSTFNYHGGSDTRSIGYADEQSPTITVEDKPPAVAFAQNSRDEVRFIGGDGSLAGALTATQGMKQQTYVTQYGEDLAGTLTARHDSSPCADRGQNIVCRASGMANAEQMHDCCPTMTARQHKDAPIVFPDEKSESTAAQSMTVRRLTPLECERLQGFPDDWTRIPWRGKDAADCPDTPRYKAIGNSMAVPVMRWLGERIVQAGVRGGEDV